MASIALSVGGVLVPRGAVAMEKGVLSNNRAATELREEKTETSDQ
jgi:hypothetical protein